MLQRICAEYVEMPGLRLSRNGLLRLTASIATPVAKKIAVQAA